MRAATNTPAELQDAFLVSSPATTAFPVVVAGRLPQRSFRGLLGVHCALRPAWPADSLKEPCLGVLQPICHLLDRPKCFRLGRASPIGIYTRGFNVPSQGTRRVETWRGGLGGAYLLPALSSAGASLAPPCSVSTSRSSNRTCGSLASGSPSEPQAFAFGMSERRMGIGYNPNVW